MPAINCALRSPLGPGTCLGRRSPVQPTDTAGGFGLLVRGQDLRRQDGSVSHGRPAPSSPQLCSYPASRTLRSHALECQLKDHKGQKICHMWSGDEGLWSECVHACMPVYTCVQVLMHAHVCMCLHVCVPYTPCVVCVCIYIWGCTRSVCVSTCVFSHVHVSKRILCVASVLMCVLCACRSVDHSSHQLLPGATHKEDESLPLLPT